MRYTSYRSCLVAATALSGALWSNAALADCVAGAGSLSTLVTCDSPGSASTNGYNTTNTGMTIQVLSSAIVSTPPTVGGPLLSAGANSVVSSFAGDFNASTYGIDAGSQSAIAIDLGGGSTVNLTSNSYTQGSILFGNATGAAVNTLNIAYSPIGGPAGFDGDVTAAGNFTLNNQGQINTPAYSVITQTGAGTVLINNGVVGGGVGSTMWSDIITDGNTTINNYAGANIYDNTDGVIIGQNGTGTSTINNDGTIDATVEMDDATNVITNSSTGTLTGGDVTLNGANNTITNNGVIDGDVFMNGTASNTYNAGSTGTAGDNGLRLPGNGAGALTGLAATSANNTLNLNGTGASTMQAAATVSNFGVVNKNDAGSWTIKNTLDGAAGKLATVNVNGGTLSVDNASFLGSGTTSVKLSNGTTLNFNGTAAGTFAGNIVDATSNTTGAVTVTGAGITTLSGTNTYSGATTIDGGTLATGSNGAVSSNSAVTIQNGGTLQVNNAITLKSLADAGTGPNTVNLNGTGVSLALNSGSFGANGGTFTGTGTLTKTGTGTFDLLGASTVNLTAPGTFVINDGTVNVGIADAIGATTAVQVNSGATTTGILNVNFSDTIGSLAGTGANAQVNIATGQTLTTGGLNSSTTFAGHIAGAGALDKEGTGAMTLTGANTYAGGTTINGGSIVGFAGTTATNGSLQGNISVASGASVEFDQTLSTIGNTSGTYAGQLSGAGFVTVVGNGTGVLTLTGDNSGLTGATNLFNNSIVSIGAANNLSSGGLNFANGTLITTADMTLANAVDIAAGGGTFNTATGTTLTLSNAITGAGALTKTGAGTLDLGTSFNSYTGGTTVSAGTLIGGAGTSIQGNVLNNATVVFNQALSVYAGDMSGTGAVVIDANPMGFSGTNTYSGTTTINAGANLDVFGTNASLSPNSAFIVDGTLGGVAFDSDQTIGSLAGASTGLIETQGFTLTAGGNNSSTTFAGTFGASSGSFTKVGTGTLTLSGTGSTLLGNLGVNAGAVDLTGTLTSATTTVGSGGTLFVDGTLTSPTVTISAGGFLKGGVGTTAGNIVGDVTNSGTIAPGHSPGILAISGSYTQTATGTYQAEIGGNGTTTVVAGTNYDRIDVSGTPGTATLAGALQVVQSGGLYVAGTNYDILTTTAGITGNFTTVSGNVISPFITLSNLTANGGGVVGNNYRLVVVRSAYNTVASNPNQVAVANGLQGLVGVTAASPTVIKIDNMTAAQAKALFDTVSPEPYAAYATALQDQGEMFTRQVAGRMAALTDDAKTGLWLNAYGQWGDGKNRNFRYGSDQKLTGIAGGVDFGAAGLHAGVGVGYSQDKVDYRLGDTHGKSKSWQAGGYVAYGAGPLHLDAQAAYIHGKINATKVVNAGSGANLIAGSSSANTKGHLFKAIATIGYDFGTNGMKLEPYAGIDFTTGHINGFTESGMGVLDLTVGRINAKRTDAIAGFRFSTAAGSITPYLNAAYRYRLNNSSRNVTAYFDGLTGSPFTVSGLNSGRSQIELDAGVSARVGGSASVFIGYQGTFRNDLKSHGGNAGVRVAF